MELAALNTVEPIKTRSIAVAQGISLRFMEVILNELKSGGFIESWRGSEGGYILARDPKELTVKEIVEFVQGPIAVSPNQETSTREILRFGDVVFRELWQEVNKAICDICNRKTFADLVELEEVKRGAKVPNYCI